MSQCKVSPCGCTNEYQDNRYGRGMRVMNPRAKAGEYRCTSCGTVKSFADEKGVKPTVVKTKA